MAAGVPGIFGDRGCETFHVYDANRWNEDAAERSNRSDSPDAASGHGEVKWNSLSSALPPEIPQRVRFAPQSRPDTSMRNRDEHPCPQQVDVMILGIARDQCAALPRQFRLQRTRSLMESRMDHTAVQPRRFPARSVVPLDACGREALHRKLSRNRAADDAS